ncbi:MAG: hypothetical protein GF317_15335 [Candidatus Lokiarchaeota archaeon]|nr:hypothetical protein [Candidatus Lokiarchaeota archaeon]
MMEKINSQKTTEKLTQVELSDTQREQVYKFANEMRNKVLEEICPALFDVCLNSERGALKNELGRVIFHLQKNERLNTRIGLEKLIDGALRVDAEKVFRILDNSGNDTRELAKKIRSVL